MNAEPGTRSRYVCLACGVISYVKSWAAETAKRAACRGCGSLSLVSTSDDLAAVAPPNPDAKRIQHPYTRHLRGRRIEWEKKTPAEQDRIRLARVKRLHKDFLARKKHGFFTKTKTLYD